MSSAEAEDTRYKADKCKAMMIGIKETHIFGLFEVGMVIARVINCPADMESSQITSIAYKTLLTSDRMSRWLDGEIVVILSFCRLSDPQ